MKLPLAIPLDSRNGNGQYDARPVNVLKESSAANESVVKRPALAKVTGPDAPANGNGLVDFNGSLISIFGAELRVAKRSFKYSPPKDIPVAVGVQYTGALIVDESTGDIFHLRPSASPDAGLISTDSGNTWETSFVPFESNLPFDIPPVWIPPYYGLSFNYRLSNRSVVVDSGERLLVAPRIGEGDFANQRFLDVYSYDNNTGWGLKGTISTPFFVSSGIYPIPTVIFDDHHGATCMLSANMFGEGSLYSPGLWISYDYGETWDKETDKPWAEALGFNMISGVSDSDTYDIDGVFTGFFVIFGNPSNYVGAEINITEPSQVAGSMVGAGASFITYSPLTGVWSANNDTSIDALFGDSFGNDGTVYALAIDADLFNYVCKITSIDPVVCTFTEFNELDSGMQVWSMALHKPSSTMAIISIDPTGTDRTVWLSTSADFGDTWTSIPLIDDEFPSVGNYKITAIQNETEAAFYLWASNGNKLWRIAKGGLRMVSLSTLTDGSFDFAQSAL